jgi:hypothetical protein
MTLNVENRESLGPNVTSAVKHDPTDSSVEFQWLSIRANYLSRQFPSQSYQWYSERFAIILCQRFLTWMFNHSFRHGQRQAPPEAIAPNGHGRDIQQLGQFFVRNAPATRPAEE